MTRHRLLALVLCLSLVLAGCSSVDGPLTEEGGATADGVGDAATDSTAGNGASGGDGGDGTASGDAVVVWERFAFSEGEFYEFRVDDRTNGKEILLTWDVVEVDGREVTADVTYDDGNASYEYTVTGENATAVSQVMQAALRDHPNDEAALDAAIATNGYFSIGPFNTFTAYFAARELAVGNSWNLAGNAKDGFMTANVEGRDEYAGKECYVSTVRVPDSEAWAETDSSEWVSCIAPDIGLSLYTAYYDAETDELAAEIVLETYRPGE